MKAPSNRDFVRQSNVSFSQPHRLRSFWQVVHVDPILLAGLLALCGFGLFVLNSATAGDTEVVTRQRARCGPLLRRAPLLILYRLALCGKVHNLAGAFVDNAHDIRIASDHSQLLDQRTPGHQQPDEKVDQAAIRDNFSVNNRRLKAGRKIGTKICWQHGR